MFYVAYRMKIAGRVRVWLFEDRGERLLCPAFEDYIGPATDKIWAEIYASEDPSPATLRIVDVMISVDEESRIWLDAQTPTEDNDRVGEVCRGSECPFCGKEIEITGADCRPPEPFEPDEIKDTCEHFFEMEDIDFVTYRGAISELHGGAGLTIELSGKER